MVTINTTQPPEARQTATSVVVTTTLTKMFDVPNYITRSNTASNEVVTIQGCAEIVSPLILCNATDTSASVDVRIKRGSVTFAIAASIYVPANDVVAVPIQGQFIFTGEELLVSSTSADTIHATISYTLGAVESNDII